MIKSKDKIVSLRDVERMKRWQKTCPDKYWEYMRQLGLISDGVIKLGDFTGINNCWKDDPCFVIACSQALQGIDLNKLNGLHTIAVNHLIETWDKSEFFLFMDERFLEISTYDLSRYEGTIFYKNSIPTLANVKRGIKVLPKEYKIAVSTKIEDGLYKCQSGLAALNLAIITGANPIYLIGHDSTTLDKSKGDHFSNNYGDSKPKINYQEYEKRKKLWYRLFLPYRDRIINVCNPEIATTFNGLFRTIPFSEIPVKPIIKRQKEIKKLIGDKSYLYKYPVDYKNNIICSSYPVKDIDCKVLNENLTEELKACGISSASIYLIAIDENEDIFDYNLFNAMMAELPIVFLNNNKNKMYKILKNCAIICNDIEEVKIHIKKLLDNPGTKIKYGELAKKRFKDFENKTIEEVLL